MNHQDLIEEAAQTIADSMEIQLPPSITEEGILGMLEIKISRLLTGSGETFFTLMYRLDISEHKLQDALADMENGVNKVSRLILERQLQKAASRKAAKHKQVDDKDKDLKW